MAKETLSSILSLEYLLKQNIKIEGVVVRSCDIQLVDVCKKNCILIFSEKDIINLYQKGFFHIDYILFFYWKRIPKEILCIANKGCINFHPGPLPEARGSGYHIAILENWGYFGVTAHFMDENFDTGDIIECRHFPIDSQIVNKDLVKLTHEQLAILFEDIMEQILEGKTLKREKQSQGNYYSIRRIEESKLIKDSDREEDISKKIKAFWNPPYNGAQIVIKGKKYTIIDEDILQWISEKIYKK